MTIKVFDTFTGSNGTDLSAHTPDTDVVGGGWTDNGANTVELDGSGALKFSNQNDECRIDAGVAAQILTANFNAGGADNRITLNVRSDDLAHLTATKYLFNFRTGDASVPLRISKRVAGSATILVSTSGTPTISNTTTYELKATVIGSTLDFLINGVSELSTTDSSITTGNFSGIKHELHTDGAARFFDFEVDDGLNPYGFTYTLPTITGSHTDFVVLLKTVDFPSAAIDGTTNAIDNGGGNLRAYTDDTKTTQLSVEVVTFVSSGSPDAQVWIKVPTAATGNTIYIEADAVQVSQPAVTATYGRNAVWGDYEVVTHLEATSATDSTGNTTLTPSGTPSTATGKIDGGVDFASGVIESNTVLSTPSAFTIQSWSDSNGATADAKILAIDNGTSDHYLDQRSGNRRFVVNNIGAGVVVGSAISSGFLMIHGTYDGTTVRLYEDGATPSTTSYSATINTVDRCRVGESPTGTENFSGVVDECRVRYSVLSADFIATEYNNQSSATAWGTVGAWSSGSSFQPAWAYTANKLIGGF